MAEIAVVLHNKKINKTTLKVVNAEGLYKAIEKSLSEQDSEELVQDVNYIDRDFESSEFHQSFSECLRELRFVKDSEESGFDFSGFSDEQITAIYKSGVNI